MQRKPRFQNIVSQVIYYSPFTTYFLLFVVGSFLAYAWLRNRPFIPDTPFYDIFSLLISITTIFGFFILSFAFLTTLIAWLYFFLQKKKNNISIKITSSVKNNNRIKIDIHPIIKPFFGFIKFRFRYNKNEYSPKFQLSETYAKKGEFTTHLAGYYQWSLPEIKEYTIDEVIIFMEDIFQFFSLAIPVSTHERFHSVPSEINVKKIVPEAKKTENILSRIDYIKKVEGDHLNYKSFENDDLRRIVWKIYAKNRELVVRIPESLDPYTSHIYLFVSFFAGFDISENETVQVPFLNYYKTVVWNIYKELKKTNNNVRFISDQSDKYILSSDLDSDVALKNLIAVSTWQQHTNIKSYIHEKNPSVIIISSLNNAEVVEQLVNDFGKKSIFYFVRLSDALRRKTSQDILEFIFIHNDSSRMRRYKTQWLLSPLRIKLLENEKKILQILNAQ